MKDAIVITVIILMCLGFFVAVWAFLAWCFVMVWNGVLPEVFDWPSLTFMHGVGIVFLLSFVSGIFKINFSRK